MDSLMAVEMKQVLERDFGINMTAPELRGLTFGKLQELTDSIDKGGKPFPLEKSEITYSILFRVLGDEKASDEIIIPLNNTNQTSDTCALFLPGMEGVISPTLRTLCEGLEIPIYAIQHHVHCRIQTFPELVQIIKKVIAFSKILYYSTLSSYIVLHFHILGCNGIIQR